MNYQSVWFIAIVKNSWLISSPTRIPIRKLFISVVRPSSKWKLSGILIENQAPKSYRASVILGHVIVDFIEQNRL